MILKPPIFAKPIHGHPLGPDGGLVAFWPMNEGRYNSTLTKVFDLSGNGLTGTFNGDITWSSGKFGSCPDFAGDADYITAATPPGLVDAITYVLWFKSDVGNAGAGGYLIRVEDTAISMDYGDIVWSPDLDLVGVDCPYTIFADVWYQIVVTQTGTSYAIYMNGILVQSGTTVALDLIQPLFDVNIGNLNAGDGVGDFDGQIDVPSIYNRVLSASEISQTFWNPSCMFEREPIELWSAATLGAPPVGNAGIMTPWGGYWGPTY